MEQDDDSTIAIYHKKVSFRSVLSGKTATPAVAAAFMQRPCRTQGSSGKRCRKPRTQRGGAAYRESRVGRKTH